jgi:hypothetical protein
MIRQKIETFDEKAHGGHSVVDDDNLQAISHVTSTRNLHQSRSIIGSEHVSLGSPSALVSIGEIEQQHVDDCSFIDFRKKIG